MSRQTSTTDARGVTISNVFDDAGQLTGQTSPNETRSFVYDGAGRRTAWTDASGSTTVAFDDVGRMTEIVTPAGTVGYSYNAAGEQVSMTQPEGTLSYGYDINGFMDSLTDWRGDTITTTNDPDGRMLDVQRSNGVDTAYGYDTAGRLTDIGHSAGATTIDSFTYSLDGNGNRVGVTSNAGTESYTLDGLNRITSATYPGAQSEAFAYDPAGNRTSHTAIDGTTTGYTVDATGQLISDTTGTTYSYDDAGNLLGTSDGDVYVYDDYGRATSITAGGVTETYTYDARDVRATVDGISQLWDRNGLPTLIETGAGDNFIHTNGVARDGDEWLLADAVGSVRATVDAAGNVSAETAFTAFGEPLTGQADSFGFAGEQLDTTGLLHLRARQYNPTIGRFTTVDPVQPGAPGTTGYNLYTYSGNNPTTFTDPSGRAVFVEDSVVRSSVAGRPFLSGGSIVAGVFVAAYTGIECSLELGPFGAPGELLPGPCGVGQRLLDGGTASDDHQPQVDVEPARPGPSTTEVPVGSLGNSPSSGNDGRQCVAVPGFVNLLPLQTVRWNGAARQFAKGASALLTEDYLARNATKTAPNPRPAPPGVEQPRYDNSHLVAASLGGSNTDGANFVSLHENKNRGRMRVLEGEVEAAVRSCEVVQLSVVPSFDFGNSAQPLEFLHFLAVSETAGVIANEVIPNTDRFGVRAG